MREFRGNREFVGGLEQAEPVANTCTKRPDTTKLLGGNPSSFYSYEKPLALDKIQVTFHDGFP